MSEQLKRVLELVDEAPISLPATAATPQHSLEPPEIARETDILARFRRDVVLRGLVGELATAQIVYLAVTSRLLDKPVSVGVKGHSSSGKSFTVSRVLELFPAEAVVTFTSMSEKALIYRDDDYAHRTIVIYEVAGLREGNEDDQTSYFVRTLLSEGRIDYTVTVRKKDGQFGTQQIRKNGPTNLIFTTTKTTVHAENETRILSLNTDDSTAQTKRVLYALADESKRAVDLKQWHALQSWLQRAEKRVSIPFAIPLADLVPPVAVRLRRDFHSVLALIQAHAILHQQSRERDEDGQIIATLDDYAAVRELVAPIISEGLGATVSEQVRGTVEAVRILTAAGGHVAVGTLAKHLGIDKSNASRRARRAADAGYIHNQQEKRGLPAKWVLGEPLPESVDVLPTGAQLATAVAAANRAVAGCCAVAPVLEGEKEAACRRCDGEGCRHCDRVEAEDGSEL
jgi:hypothetical protein